MAVILFSVYFFVRIIDHVPAFLSIVKMPPAAETPKKQARFYPDNMSSIVAGWVENRHFCKENLNAGDAARQMNTNRSYLSAYLNQELGMTYSKWLNTLRIEYAKELIKKNPDKKISEIGVLAGIPEVYNFSRRFKQATGMSPQKWMETARETV